MGSGGLTRAGKRPVEVAQWWGEKGLISQQPVRFRVSLRVAVPSYIRETPFPFAIVRRGHLEVPCRDRSRTPFAVVLPERPFGKRSRRGHEDAINFAGTPRPSLGPDIEMTDPAAMLALPVTMLARLGIVEPRAVTEYSILSI